MFSLETFQKRYETETTELVIRGRTFHFFVPGNLEPLVHPEDLFRDFPLWSKPWEASWVLADYFAGMAPDPEKRFLEIGAGMGLVGVVASAFGHRFIVTEHDPHAIQFVRANALLNHCEDLEIREMDWNNPSLEGLFDGIVGCEVTYHERDFRPLHRLFRTLLKPKGTVILCGEVRKTSMDFFKQLQPHFEITAHKKTLRGRGEEIHIILALMVSKD